MKSSRSVINRGTLLEAFVRDLHSYLSEHLPGVWLLTIADNGSAHDSWPTASALAEILPNVRAARFEDKMGRKELRFRWNHSHALVAAFIGVQASPDFDRTLALLIKDANREAQPSIGQDHRFTRRQAVTAIGTVGLGSFLAACTSNSTATTANSTTPSTGPTTTAGTGATTTTTAGAVLDCVLGNYGRPVLPRP